MNISAFDVAYDAKPAPRPTPTPTPPPSPTPTPTPPPPPSPTPTPKPAPTPTVTMNPDGSLKLPTLPDAHVSANSLYYSSTTGRLTYRDPSGSFHRA